MEKIFYGTDESQYGELRLPENGGPYPVAIVIHGGFWKESFGLDLMTDAAEDLTAHGLATWNIEYRRVGQAGGAWPGTLTDAAKACDYLASLAETYPLDLNQVITIGHSAGGHLALWLAARHHLPKDGELNITSSPLPISGAISLAGVNDLEMMYGVHHFRDQTFSMEPNNPTADLLQSTPEDHPERYQQASPIELLPLGVPQVLVHGALDVNVPIGISNHYHRQAQEFGDLVKLVELPEAEHFMLTDTYTQAWTEIREEVKTLLLNIGR
ncbi:alpha/beta hydrolase family protein [Halobacillus amylolyticus]|uniref:Alpha/beta hydrolase n=1 Tax=Halobacillus amylolyticus TaxID=2932259 RepID=A0ABY4HGF8_9BACI|nr:alpha/beta hydrolase [Halobacillus amylolyticus]UOR13829.1 alpha/beta hydrolase [Halobacillus amylolyticus]